MYPVKHFHVLLTTHILCNRTEGGCRCKMLCVHVYIISQFMAVGFYRDQKWCSCSMCDKPAQYISYFSWKLIRSPCFLPARGVSSLSFPKVESYWVSYLSWHFQGPMRCKGFLWWYSGLGALAYCGWGLLFWWRRAEMVISTESQRGTGTWHGFLENISRDEWCPHWLSPSLLSHEAGTMEKISSAALW